MQTRAQAELGQTDERMAPVRALLRSIARDDGVRRALAEMVSGLDTRYDVADAGADARSADARQARAERAGSSTDPRRPSPRACVGTCGARHCAERARHRARGASPWRIGSSVATCPGADDAGWLAGRDAALVRPDGHIAPLRRRRRTPRRRTPVALERGSATGEKDSAVAARRPRRRSVCRRPTRRRARRRLRDHAQPVATTPKKSCIG